MGLRLRGTAWLSDVAASGWRERAGWWATESEDDSSSDAEASSLLDAGAGRLRCAVAPWPWAAWVDGGAGGATGRSSTEALGLRLRGTAGLPELGEAAGSRDVAGVLGAPSM